MVVVCERTKRLQNVELGRFSINTRDAVSNFRGDTFNRLEHHRSHTVVRVVQIVGVRQERVTRVIRASGRFRDDRQDHPSRRRVVEADKRVLQNVRIAIETSTQAVPLGSSRN